MYMVQKEIDDEEERRNAAKPKPIGKSPANKLPAKSNTNAILDERQLKKQIGNLEKSIAKLDAQRKQLHEQLMAATDPKDALRLHEEMTQVASELELAEGKWAELQEQIESLDP
jgi:ATP-binding cassette subfamily F protein 3